MNARAKELSELCDGSAQGGTPPWRRERPADLPFLHRMAMKKRRAATPSLPREPLGAKIGLGSPPSEEVIDAPVCLGIRVSLPKRNRRRADVY
jgi:hypothetical protein